MTVALRSVPPTRSYAVAWQRDGGTLQAGRLDLRPRALRVTGTAGASEIPLADVEAAHLVRRGDVRLAGRPTLVVELRNGGVLRVASVGQPGALTELAGLVSAAIGVD